MPNPRNIIIYVCIAGAIFALYFFFLKPEPEAENLVSVPAPPSPSDPNGRIVNLPAGESLVTENFLSLFLSVKNIKLDAAAFTNPVFKNLRDSSIELVSDGTEGRRNPFAKLGSDAPPPPPPAPEPETDTDSEADLDALLNELPAE